MNSSPITRILFMGTPDFAVPSLQKLHENSAPHHWQIITVMTQPDRRAGRGKKLAMSPVKQYAVAENLPLLQPEHLRKQPAVIDEIANLAPDLIIVAAYGLILPKRLLEIPTFGCVNVHASLLPAYRGASPINTVILDGLPETGVSIMLMDEGLDTGPVLSQTRQKIGSHETAQHLTERLAEEGGNLLIETLPQWLAGNLPPIAQDDLPGVPTLCRTIKKEAGKIDWQQPAHQIERMTRAYAPWPSAFTSWQGQVFKVWQVAVRDGQAKPGQIIQTADGPAVGTGKGLLLLKSVQPAGKRAMDVQSFLNGAENFVGSQLGE